MVTGYRIEGRVSIPGQVLEIFLYYIVCRLTLVPIQPPVQSRALSPRIKRPKREVDD
jgi:hypothetical protein